MLNTKIYPLPKCQWNIIRLGFLIFDSGYGTLSCLGTNFKFFESNGVKSLTFWNKIIQIWIVLVNHIITNVIRCHSVSMICKILELKYVLLKVLTQSFF